MKLPGRRGNCEAWRLAHRRFHGGGAISRVAARARRALPLARRDRRAWRADRKTDRRFSPAESVVHWSVALSFSILGITGLVMGLGKYVLIPFFGHTLFAWLADVSKRCITYRAGVPCFLPILIAIFVPRQLPGRPTTSDW